jgi:hypothetical protein
MGMNGYVCFHNRKRVEVRAETSQRAQTEAARLLRVKRVWEVTVVLAEKADGTEVIHTATF